MIPPGSRVSCPPAMSISTGVTVTVVLAPAASVPADGATLSTPIRLCDSVMDHLTGPFEAVRMRVTERPGRGVIVLGSTVSVPCGGGGWALRVAVADLADGVGEARRDADPVAEGRDVDGEPSAAPTVGGTRPTVTVTITEGDARPDLVGRADPGPAPAPP